MTTKSSAARKSHQNVSRGVQQIRKDAGRLADFIMFSQRSFLLDLSKELNKGNVCFAQFFLLGYLAKEDYLTMADIAKKMGHSTAAATGLVDRLEKLGYVQRFHAPDDRRKVMVQITRKGMLFVDEIHEELVESCVEVMAEVDDGVAEAVCEASAVFSDASDGAEEITEEEGGDELVAAVNRGLPQEFWMEYRALQKKRENGVLSADERDQLIEMSDQIEKADAERLDAAAKLADIRAVSFRDIVSEYDLGASNH